MEGDCAQIAWEMLLSDKFSPGSANVAKAAIVGRRGFLTGAAAVASAAALSQKAFATAAPQSPEQRRVLQIAQQQVQRYTSQLWRTDIVGVVDFSRPSSQPRMFIANLESGEVLPYLVAHGRGSDPEHDGWLKNFSGQPGSQATSRGAYMSLEWYVGKYGMSMRLQGLEEDNYTALDRAIVVHEAWYCAPDMIGRWGKLGRSEGCFAMSPGKMQDALYFLGGGRLLFADRLDIAPIEQPPYIAPPQPVIMPEPSTPALPVPAHPVADAAPSLSGGITPLR